MLFSPRACWRPLLILAAAGRSPGPACSSDGLTDEFAKRATESGLLRPAAIREAESGALWDGPTPERHYEPLDVIELTLRALRSNDDPQPHAGTALLRRFSSGLNGMHSRLCYA